MGKKVKTGKARRDKAYWSAKEIGYRSRASFKLIQLNRKFEFLQRSRVCVDLCAAPGSWMQVAREHMPMSSLIVGVDLVPIKPIPGCIALQGDITTDRCRTDLRRELQTWKADLVLHDGAPNVGRSWLHDAYQQSVLTLASFKMATEFLIKGGSFVTKVFRSRDYQALLWVLNQFFKRVHATKPAASRHESAEIFVVCLGYKAPDKIDPRFLDPKHVFSEVSEDGGAPGEGQDNDQQQQELLNPEKKERRKAPAEGYEQGATLLFRQAKASDFIAGDQPVAVLNNCHEIVLDLPSIRRHHKTTPEIVECCKDIKVLGIKELRLLKKWREALRAANILQDDDPLSGSKSEGKKDENEAGGSQEDGEDEDNVEDEDLMKLEDEIDLLDDEDRRIERRKKKKALKLKRKAEERVNLKMVIPGDQGPTLQEDGLFSMKMVKSAKEIETVIDQEPETLAGSEDEEEDEDEARRRKRAQKVEKYSKEKGTMDQSGLYYKASDDDDDDEDEDDEDEEDDSGREDLGLSQDGDCDDQEDDDYDEMEIEEMNDKHSNPLLVDLDTQDRDQRKQAKAKMFFDKDIFQGIEDDEDLEEADVEEAMAAIKKKGGQIRQKVIKNRKGLGDPKAQKNGGMGSDGNSEDEDDDSSSSSSERKMGKKNGVPNGQLDDDESSDSSSESDSDSESGNFYPYAKQKAGTKANINLKKGKNVGDDDTEFEVVPVEEATKPGKKKRRPPVLTPEELALGQELITSKKRRRELEDMAWNRYRFEDKDKDLPDWFVKEEEYHMRRRPEVDPKVVEFYRERQRDVNVKTIKKVVEAKARKKRRIAKKMEKAKKRAAAILDNTDLGSREKAREIDRLYKKATKEKKKEVSYVVAKKATASKRAKRPSGIKGPYKQVDPRMKKDNTAKRSNATSKRLQKRRLKGRKTKAQ